MSQVACQTCGAKTDAPLCTTHTDQLAKLIRALPAGLNDLRTTATRQARVGDIPLRAATIPTEWTLADLDDQRLPAMLRSQHGRIALPSTTLPVSLGAAELYRQAVRGILSWACEANLTGRTVAGTCQALADGIDQVRHLDNAGRIHSAALDLTAWIETTIDRRPPGEFVGVCPAASVRVDLQPLTGPPCSGLTCHHQSCEDIRQRRTRIAPVPGVCGQPLVIAEAATVVTCEACGVEHDAAEQRKATADKLADKLGTVREVAGFLRTLELPVTVDKVDGWLRRGRIASYGLSATRHKLVKVGEVRAYAEDQADRTKTRRPRIA